MKKYLVIAFALVLAGSYIAVYKWAVAKTEAQHSEDVTRVVEQALLEYQEEVRHANEKNTDLQQAAQLDEQRIKQLRKKLDSSPVSCSPSPTDIFMLNETIRDKRLHPASDTAELIDQGDSTAGICVAAIGEANRVKIKLNNLINEL